MTQMRLARAFSLLVLALLTACAPFTAAPIQGAGATAGSSGTADLSTAGEHGFDPGFDSPATVPTTAPTASSAPGASMTTAPQAPATGVAPSPTPKTTAKTTLAITAVGDVQLGRAWPEAAADLPPDGPYTLFAHVRDFLSAGDLTFGNLETALADRGDSYKCGKHSKACYAFRAPAAYAKALADIGFAVVSSANNHAGDFGPEGRAATRAALDEAHIAHSGVKGELASLERQGRRIGVLAFAFGDGMNRVQDLDAARELVTAARRDHDIVIVSMHVGAEGTNATHVTRAREIFMGEDRGNAYAFAHTVVDAGAALVIGHGPHVLRGMELYKGHLIAYSLGNFCAWRSFSLGGPLAITGILQVSLADDGTLVTAKLTPFILEGAGVPTPDPRSQAIKLVRDLSLADFGDALLDANGSYESAAMTAKAP